MKHAFYRTLILWACLLVTVATVQADPTACLTHAQAEAITFAWTDAAGVPHTSSLADRATDPRHIIALLREAYTNTAVPGPWQSAYSSTGTRQGDVYYGAVKNSGGTTVTGWNITKTSSTAYKPKTEGYTLFIVAVKDSYDGSLSVDYGTMSLTTLINYFDKTIESVQLLTDGWVDNDPANPGMVFTLTGSYNRFFFLSKGKARINQNVENDNGVSIVNGAKPFYRMFEEFSPYDGQDSHSDISDFYSTLIAGEPFAVKHDCNSVIGRKHYFSMSGESGTTHYDVTGLNFKIPFKRLTYFKRTGTGPTDGRSDGSSTQPTAKYANYNQEYQPDMFMYAVRLTADAAELSAVDHTYTVTLDWSTTYDKSESQIFEIYRVVDGVAQDTPIATLTDVYTWSETVAQETHGVTLTYVVRGRPVNAAFGAVTSNQTSVIIPGYDPQERLKLTISGKYESTYDYDKQINRYANYIVFNNGEGTSVTREFLENGTQFKLYRMEQGSDDPGKIVATVTVTSLTADRCDYEVNYNYQEDAVESKYPALTGYFTFNDDDEVQFNDFMVCDQFTASTAANDHLAKYTYQVLFKSVKQFADLDGNLTDEVYSNTADVIVYKTDYTLSGDRFTAAQVEADVDGHNLLPLQGGVAMSLAALNDRNVLNYYMVRDGVNDGVDGPYAQNTNDGFYAVHNSDGTLTSQPAAQVSIVDVAPEAGLHSYLPVIETYRNDGSTARNTYGTGITQAAAVTMSVTLNSDDYVMSEDTFSDGQGRYYLAGLTCEVVLPEGFELSKVRVWRFCDDAMEVQERYKFRLDQSVPIYDGTPESTWFQLGGDAMIFGAKNVDKVGDVEATFVARVYAHDASASAAPAQHRAPAQGEYVVSETECTILFNHQMPTGIENIATARQVATVAYVDPMGHVSSTPLPGINIVVTRYTDGSLHTSKAVY